MWGQENTRQGNAAAVGKVCSFFCWFFFCLLLLLGFLFFFFVVVVVLFFLEGAWERK